MRAVVMYAPGDIRVEDREDPTIVEPTDAIIRLAATCICGSDLWPYRGDDDVDHTPMGHEYVGVVTEIGDDVKTLRVGDFVVGSFFASDNTCEICQAGYQSRCIHAYPMGALGTQESMMQAIRAPRAGGHIGYVGVSHDVSLDGHELFFSGVHLHGGPAPVRRFLPELIQLIWDRKIDPGKVFDLALPLDQAAEGYRAMDERRAIKVLLTTD